MHTLLTIAGFDPSSGAGVTADLLVFAAHGCFGVSCITALTVQSTKGVREVVPVHASTVRATLECLQDDMPPAGIKVGMLGTAENVRSVARYLELIQSTKRLPVVLDPVLRSSSGKALLPAEAVSLLRDILLPWVDWITPNLDELSVLTRRRLRTRLEVIEAARELQASAPQLNIVVTGGHMDPPDDLLLGRGAEPHWIPGQRVETRATHGTGCAFSSALLVGLVLGYDGHAAAQAAKHYVRRAMESAPQLGSGAGPLNHLWPRRSGDGK